MSINEERMNVKRIDDCLIKIGEEWFRFDGIDEEGEFYLEKVILKAPIKWEPTEDYREVDPSNFWQKFKVFWADGMDEERIDQWILTNKLKARLSALEEIPQKPISDDSGDGSEFEALIRRYIPLDVFDDIEFQYTYSGTTEYLTCIIRKVLSMLGHEQQEYYGGDFEISFNPSKNLFRFSPGDCLDEDLVKSVENLVIANMETGKG